MNIHENVLKLILQFNIVIDTLNQILLSINEQPLDIKAELDIIKNKITDSISSDETNKAKLNIDEFSSEQTPTSLNLNHDEITEVMLESMRLFNLIEVFEWLCDIASIMDSRLNFECEFASIKDKTVNVFLNSAFLPKEEKDALKDKVLNNTLF